MAVNNSASDSKKLKFDDVVGILLSQDMRGKFTSETSSYPGALIVENKGRLRERGANKNQGKVEGSSKGKGNMECWYCGKNGHLKKDCWSRKVDGKEGNEGNNHEANMVGEILQDALILSLDIHNDCWVIDSSVSFHATSHKDYFIDYI